ncbi:hypothetical protein [Micromonospora hortensis]|uniref:hypothetical protein n=1 Tax=Micromonospora hortensis TaxID=2911209 RepID=UPI001EE95323|nr:hypothetical protein [Micromonospora hortensis]MCG5453532.1 hypothetical protein [Micromonospora hortensis]
MDEQPEPVILHLYCRVDVVVTDSAAVTGHAVADLRSAGIDWPAEEDDLDTAGEELRGSPTASLASVADISRLVENIPGVEFRGGHCWAESGPVREAFPTR